MSFLYWLMAAALASLPLAAAAQQKPTPPNPADPHATVPAFIYDSAFKKQSATTEPPTPDKAWRQANWDMQVLGGHVGHIRNRATSPPAAVEQSHHGKGH
jgi:hypothetical protein